MRCEEVIRELAAPVPGQDRAAISEHLEHCPACAEWSARMVAFDRLWARTRPADPSPEVWEGIWSRLDRAFDESQVGSEEPARIKGGDHTPHTLLRIAPGSSLKEERRTLPTASAARTVARPDVRSLLGNKGLQAIAAIAAAVLIGFCLPFSWNVDRKQGDAVLPVASSDRRGDAVSPAIGSFDIEPGQLVVIRSADPLVADAASGVEIIRPDSDDRSGAPDAIFGNGDVEAMYVMFNTVESMANPVVAVR